MTIQSQPAEQSVALYNRLISLPYSEQAEIQRIAWQLRHLRRSLPREPAVAVALLFALRMSGEASQAIQVADEVWTSRSQLDIRALHSYFQHLVSLGRYEKALTLFREVPTDVTRKSRMWIDWAWLGSVGSGHVSDLVRRNFFESSAPVENVDHPERSAEREWFEQLENLQLVGAFEDYMARVNEIVGGRQCAIDCTIGRYDGPAELGHVIYVGATRDERRALEARIDEAVDSNPLMDMPTQPIFITTLVASIASRRPNEVRQSML